MGLSSLSHLNRSGAYSFWGSSWDSCKTYKHYYYHNIYINTIVKEVLSNFFFNQLYLNKKLKLGLKSKYKIINNTKNKNLFFTKLWYFKYQNWIIILTNYFKIKIFKKIKYKSIRLKKKFVNFKIKGLINYNYKF